MSVRAELGPSFTTELPVGAGCVGVRRKPAELTARWHADRRRPLRERREPASTGVNRRITGPGSVSGVGEILGGVGEQPAPARSECRWHSSVRIWGFPNSQAIPLFLLRLEMGSGECFVGVAGISNNFQLRLEMVSVENEVKGFRVEARR